MWTDKKSMSYFIEMQEKIKPTMSIEVGAYDADFSKLIVKNNIPVYAFEGSPAVYNNFKNFLTDINYIHAVITDYDGEADFLYLVPENQAAEIGHNGIKSGRHKVDSSVVVQCYSLDSYFKDINNQNIVLWIDCEGANKEVLEGASSLLKQVSSIYIEVEHKDIWKNIWLREDVIKYLESHGFELIKEYSAYINQTNCIFVRKELVASL
jgi:FkbM family methyltransferase